MSRISRREFLKASGAAAATSLLSGCVTQPSGPSKPIGRVIVIGGGFGGATAAKYLRMWSEGTIEVFLIERNAEFISCPTSNLVLGGTRTLADITRSYAKLREYGVQVLRDEATAIDVEKKRVSLKRIEDLPYDRLIVSPACMPGRPAPKQSRCGSSSRRCATAACMSSRFRGPPTAARRDPTNAPARWRSTSSRPSRAPR